MVVVVVVVVIDNDEKEVVEMRKEKFEKAFLGL